MVIVALLLFVVASIVTVFYGIVLVIRAFKTSIWWGLAYLLIPFAALVFIITHWDIAKQPFLRGLIAIPLYVIAIALSPTQFMPDGQDISIADGTEISTAYNSYEADQDTNLDTAPVEIVGVDSDESEPAVSIQAPSWIPAGTDDVSAYLQKRIKVNTVQGTERIGVLTQISDIGLLMTSDEGSQYLIPPRQIKTLHVASD